MRKLKLQVALDITDLGAAMLTAAQVVDSADHIEIGTLLLRHYGTRAIEVLRAEFEGAILVADCKTIDCGEIEAELAISAGADAVTVQAVAPRETIEAVCRTARKMGAFVMADSIGIRDMRELARKLDGLPLSQVILHRGRDEQSTRGPIPVHETVDAAAAVTLPPLAIAGGITLNDAAGLNALSGIDTVIVGQAIVASSAPGDAAREFRSVLSGVGDEHGARRDFLVGTI